jgi:hypothetical protein
MEISQCSLSLNPILSLKAKGWKLRQTQRLRLAVET